MSSSQLQLSPQQLQQQPQPQGQPQVQPQPQGQQPQVEIIESPIDAKTASQTADKSAFTQIWTAINERMKAGHHFLLVSKPLSALVLKDLTENKGYVVLESQYAVLVEW